MSTDDRDFIAAARGMVERTEAAIEAAGADDIRVRDLSSATPCERGAGRATMDVSAYVTDGTDAETVFDQVLARWEELGLDVRREEPRDDILTATAGWDPDHTVHRVRVHLHRPFPLVGLSGRTDCIPLPDERRTFELNEDDWFLDQIDPGGESFRHDLTPPDPEG